MTYTLIIIACLAAHPATCAPHDIYLDGNVIHARPYIDIAEQEAVEWMADHPRLLLKSMTLVPGRIA